MSVSSPKESADVFFRGSLVVSVLPVPAGPAGAPQLMAAIKVLLLLGYVHMHIYIYIYIYRYVCMYV